MYRGNAVGTAESALFSSDRSGKLRFSACLKIFRFSILSPSCLFHPPWPLKGEKACSFSPGYPDSYREGKGVKEKIEM